MPERTHDGIKKRRTCSKRQWPKCSHSWWFSFHWRDVEHRYSLGKITKARGIDPHFRVCNVCRSAIGSG
jgi:hypothetical protein